MKQVISQCIWLPEILCIEHTHKAAKLCNIVRNDPEKKSIQPRQFSNFAPHIYSIIHKNTNSMQKSQAQCLDSPWEFLPFYDIKDVPDVLLHDIHQDILNVLPWQVYILFNIFLLLRGMSL